MKIPVVPAPTPNKIDTDISNIYNNAFSKLLNDNTTEPWADALHILQDHFNYYCTERWPHLFASLNAWTKYFQEIQPKAVIVSSLPDAESNLPAIAANRLDIQSISIPHGACQIAKTAIKTEVMYRLVGSTLQKKQFKRILKQTDKLILCKDVLYDNEYKVSDLMFKQDTSKIPILIILHPTLRNDNICPFFALKSQEEAIKKIFNIPYDLKEKVDIKIKLHPGFPDIDFIKSMGIDIAHAILPIDSDLVKLIENFDLVIGVNYFGSAIPHILKHSRPIIYLWNDLSIGNAPPFHYAYDYSKTGVIIKKSKYIWPLINKFIVNEKFKDALITRSVKYYNMYFGNKKSRGLIEVLNDILS